jgi:hypothetical protein
MTSSTSNTSRSSWLCAAVLVLWTSIAFAGHKRVVVLDFDGPKADKFHDEIVKALKKKDHTIIGTDKWNGTAEELQATKLNKKNARKIAKRLKVDGIVTASIEKSDEGYVVHVKLRAGKSGAVVAEQIDLKSEGTKLSRKEINDQLVTPIEGLEDNGGGAAETPDAGGDDDGAPATTSAHGAFSKHGAGTEQTGADATETKTATKTKDPEPKPEETHHKKHGQVASTTEDDGTSVSATAHVDEPAPSGDLLTPAMRAVDFGVGMSFTARHLSYSVSPTLSNVPPGYKQGIPVAGGVLDATVYPFAITHKSTGILTDLGIEVMYDKVIDISSKKNYIDMTTMAQQTATLATDEDHFSIGAVFRYPLNEGFVVGGKLMYMNQQFEIAQSFQNGTMTVGTDVPNVHYSAVQPNAFVHYTVTPQIIANADFGFDFITKTGDITSDKTGYGGAKDLGFEFTGGIDYKLTKAFFARALFHFEEISMTFKGDMNSLANTRDNMQMTQDVNGAKDYYYGGSVQIGIAY